MPETIKVVVVDPDALNADEGRIVIGEFSVHADVQMQDRFFDLKGRNFGEKKPSEKARFYNNKKAVK